MSPIVPDFGDEPVCACGDDADDHVFTGGGFCNLCECERYTPFGTRPTTPADPSPGDDGCRCGGYCEHGVTTPARGAS